jgi:hypothetical protein
MIDNDECGAIDGLIDFLIYHSGYKNISSWNASRKWVVFPSSADTEYAQFSVIQSRNSNIHSVNHNHKVRESKANAVTDGGVP